MRGFTALCRISLAHKMPLGGNRALIIAKFKGRCIPKNVVHLWHRFFRF